jgi:hypothetical protein
MTYNMQTKTLTTGDDDVRNLPARSHNSDLIEHFSAVDDFHFERKKVVSRKNHERFRSHRVLGLQ